MGLHFHAEVELILLSEHAEHEVDVVRIVLIFGVAAQRLVLIFGVGLVEQVQIAVPLAVLRCESAEEVFAQIGEIVCGTVALAVRILELITHLQERSLPQRFAVCSLYAVAVRLGRRHAVAVGLVGRVGERVVFHLYLIQMDVVC